MFHSLAFITCALTALSLAQGEGSGSNSGSGSVSGSGAKASLPALVAPAPAPAPGRGPTPASDIALPMAGSSKQLSRCHQSCNQQVSRRTQNPDPDPDPEPWLSTNLNRAGHIGKENNHLLFRLITGCVFQWHSTILTFPTNFVCTIIPICHGSWVYLSLSNLTLQSLS